MGARVLQWPHQGAKNSTSEGLPDLRTMSSKLLGVRSRTEEEAREVLARARPARRMFLMVYMFVVVGCG